MTFIATIWSEDAPGLERRLHEQFLSLHVRGEWHRAEEPLLGYIAALPQSWK